MIENQTCLARNPDDVRERPIGKWHEWVNGISVEKSTGELTGEDVVPGFACPVAELFP